LAFDIKHTKIQDNLAHGKRMTRIFLTGIGTDVGKTVCAAWLCRQWQAAYYKPVQAGLPRDAETVAHLAQLPAARVVPEAFILDLPASPHQAAATQGMRLSVQEIVAARSLPDGPLVIEGAGGLLVPLNEAETMADLALAFGLPIVIVWKQYLGSINHMLLTLEVATKRGLPIAGLIINGEENPSSTAAVLGRYNLPIIARLPWAASPDALFQRR
jgi:dethiobiotin synthetase